MAAPATKAEMNKEKAKEVEASTISNTPNSSRTTAAEQKANTAKSKELSKSTKAQKQADVKATATETDASGARATAAEQKANTAISKQVPKEKVNLGTPAAEKEMAKKATP